MLGLIALIVLGIMAILMLGWIVIAAHAWAAGFLEYKSRPRTAMVYCPSGHGLYRAEHALALPGTDAKMCPQCWVDAMRKAK